MQDAVLVGYFEFGWGAGVEDDLVGGERGVGVEHVDLLAVGARGLEEREAVGLVLGEGLFVAVDDVVGVVRELAECDEAAALADLVRAGDLVGLGVAVERRRGLGLQDAFFAPLCERGGGAGVDVGACFCIFGELLAEDDSDQVVRAERVVALLHRRRDLVVGLGDDVGHIDACGVITKCAERIETSHNRIVRTRGLRMSQPPAMPAMISSGSLPFAMGAGSGASSARREMSSSQAKKRRKARRCWVV